MDPYVKNPSAAANPGPFSEGDRVLVPFHPHPVEGDRHLGSGHPGDRAAVLSRPDSAR